MGIAWSHQAVTGKDACGHLANNTQGHKFILLCMKQAVHSLVDNI